MSLFHRYRASTPVLRRVLLATLLAPGLLVLPALSSPAQAQDEPHPVATGVQELDVRGVDAAAADQVRTQGSGASPALQADDPARRTVLLTPERDTRPYSLVGVTWAHDPAVGTVDAWARTRTGGTWSSWEQVGAAADEEPDTGTPDVAGPTRDGTAPLWTGPADGVQVRVDVVTGDSPRDLRVALVDPGTSTADAPVAEGSWNAAGNLGTGARPPIRSRADWGADESIRKASPAYAPRIKAAVIHHTASPNGYSPAQVPALLRGFYAYHVQSRGWSDIGYNVLVDRFGTAWEGRAGGLDRAVIGSHAGGFNTGTVGISMIGTYEDLAPSAATLETVARVAAWKLGGVDPRATQAISSGGSTRFAAGTTVTLPTVMGHRQVSTTSCPGRLGYAALPGLRERIAALQGGAPAVAQGPLQLVVPPVVQSDSQAPVLVRGGRPGAAVEVFFAPRGDTVATKRRDGTFGIDGTYRTTFGVDDDWTLFAASEGVATGRSSVTRSPAATGTPVATAATVSVQGPLTVLHGGTVLLTVTGPAGADVGVWFRPEGADTFTRRREGSLDAAGTYRTSYVADVPMEYFARTDLTASAEAATAVGPVPDGLTVQAPEAVPAGGSVPVVVQGTPGAPVAVWFARHGDTAFTQRREGVLGPDGTLRTSYVGADDHTVFATSGAGSSARVTTRVTGSPTVVAPAAPQVGLAVPATVDAGSEVPVVVSGPKGAAGQLWARRRGQAVFTRVRTGTLDTAGRWATGFTATDDDELWAAAGAAGSPDVATLVRPVLTGPASAALGARLRLTGRARPGDTVSVEQQRRSDGQSFGTTVTADATGAFTSSLAFDDEYTYRASSAGRVGAQGRTTVAPTLAGPPPAVRGSTVAVTGTARPGSQVLVLFRGPAPLPGRRARALPLFRLGRTLTADAGGRYRTTFVLTGRYDVRAVADGNASPVAVALTR